MSRRIDMYPGYTVARYADRYLSWLTDYSRNRTTATRAPLPFLLLALVIALLTWYFIRYAAIIGLGVDVVLPVATILYVLALGSCLLADIMKREWHWQWGSGDFPDRLDDAVFIKLRGPNQAVYKCANGTRMIIRIVRSTDNKTFFRKTCPDRSTKAVFERSN